MAADGERAARVEGQRKPKAIPAAKRPVKSGVARRELELGVVGASRRHRGVTFEPFFRDEVVLAVPAGHPFAGRTMTPEQLKTEQLVLMQELLPDNRGAAVGLSIFMVTVASAVGTITVGALGQLIGLQAALILAAAVALLALPFVTLLPETRHVSGRLP